MKILLLDGASLTSRETVTVLGKNSEIDIFSSSKYGISRFSKFCRTYIQGNASNDIRAYLNQIMTLNDTGNYTVVLPIHEEGWLLSWGKERIKSLPLLISSPESYEQVQGKISFARLLDKLEISQPSWCLYPENKNFTLYPSWVKANYGTAGRGVLKVNSESEMAQALHFFENATPDELMVQENIDGDYGQVQAAFQKGKLIAIHSSLKIGTGVGGSAAARISIDSSPFIESVSKIGEIIEWNGGITFDFIKNESGFYFIECNPRMVEPGNAAAAGINFPLILIDLTRAKPTLPNLLIGRPGIKTHSTLGLLMGCAEQTGKRRKILKTFFDCIFHLAERKDSTEVLTPIWKDWKSVIPLAVGFIRLLVQPTDVKRMTEDAVAHYQIDRDTIIKLREMLEGS